MVTETSKEAYENILPELGERQLSVFKALRFLKYATNSMLSEYLGWSINRVTPRCKELRTSGLVEYSHTSWCPITKNRAKYWKISQNTLIPKHFEATDLNQKELAQMKIDLNKLSESDMYLWQK